MTNSGAKRRIGTVEGVAFLLAVLACLVLFLKILPNLNENASYYEEKIVNMETRLDRIEVAVTNLQESARSMKYYREVGAVRDAMTALDGLETRLPEQDRELARQLRQDFENLLGRLEEPAP